MKSKESKEKLFSVTAKDCKWDFYNGQGKGGQNRNKRANCARVLHPPSGARGKSEDERDKPANMRKAFKRMSETKEFKTWMRLEINRHLGKEAEIEAKVYRMLATETKTQTKDEEGRWVDNDELKPNGLDLILLKAQGA